MQEQIEKDLKQALLAGDKAKTEVLKGLKNALQYEAVAQRIKLDGLKDEQIQKVLAREAKKRQEAAEVYKQAGEVSRSETELAEKKIIESYLPEQLDEQAISKAVEEEVAKVENPTPADMGPIIGAVLGRLGASADGSVVARLVKQKLQ